MIYVTGDTHGDYDRFRSPVLKKLRKEDVLMICGDFGFIWDGTKAEEKFLKKIGRRRYDTVFVEGCHDNYDLLKEYPLVPYRGGQARKICGNLYQLMRGEIYEICGKSVFAFGGGDNTEQGLEGGRWWPEEQPSEEEQQHGVDSLRAHQGTANLILTHDAPLSIKQLLQMDNSDSSCIHGYLDYIAKNCTFDQWFFGCYHMDKVIPPRYRAMFREIYPVK